MTFKAMLVISGMWIVSSDVCFAGVGVGMPGVVKNKVKELDAKVREYKVSFAPTNLRAIYLSATQISLVWQDHSALCLVCG